MKESYFKMYLFGYGSLINLSSAQKSFKRRLTQDDLIPVTVKNYKKIWNSIESIKFDEEHVNGVFLNLEKDINAKTNGVIIKITEEELVLLKLREKNYTCITINASDAINITINEDIIAFMTTNDDKLAKHGDKDTYIPSKYIGILTNSFATYEINFVDEYKKCLDVLPFPLREGAYLFTDSMQQKIARDGIDI
jgi:cation transport regulator ChaC